jgi:methionyl-tRNA synthetase
MSEDLKRATEQYNRDEARAENERDRAAQDHHFGDRRAYGDHCGDCGASLHFEIDEELGWCENEACGTEYHIYRTPDGWEKGEKTE